jgi:tripartite-type tricarboxylate transporter receptor subunit TctC
MKISFAPLSCVLSLWGSASFAEVSASCIEDLSGERMTVVVSNAPGGGYDTYARALAPVIETHGQLTARVVNMEAGGGLAARSFAMNTDPDDLVILLENTSALVTSAMGEIGRGAHAGKAYQVEGFDILGIAHVAVGAWLAGSDFDITDTDQGTILAADGDLEGALVSVVLAGSTLGFETDVVAGYSGSNDQASAVLRGEVDITTMSLTTAQRIASDESFSVVLALADSPVQNSPDLPYIAGEGSLVWQLTEGLDPEEKAERRNMAQAVSDLESAARGIFMSLNAPEARRNCVAQVIFTAMNDAAFIDAAEAQGRPVAPRDRAQSRAILDSLQTSFVNVQPMLDSVLAERLAN